MYGLPKDIDLSFFVGADLLQVCLGANELILNFDHQIRVTIESRFRIRKKDGEETTFEDAPSSAAHLVELLSQPIAEASGREDGTLCLSFAQGTSLEIDDSWESYESYQIQYGDVLYVI